MPQVRYTMPAYWGTSLSFSAETPETQIATGNGLESSDAGAIPTATTTCTVAALGDGHDLQHVGADQWCDATQPRQGDGARLHRRLVLAAALGSRRRLRGAASRSRRDRRPLLLSRSLSAMAAISAWISSRAGSVGRRTTSPVHFTGGEAHRRLPERQRPTSRLATNFTAATALGGPATAASAALIIASRPPEFGGEIGYQHWWARQSAQQHQLRHQPPRHPDQAGRRGTGCVRSTRS